MRTIGSISLALALLLLPSTMLAERLDGEFGTEQEAQVADTNDACIVTEGTDFRARGQVTDFSEGCTIEISYDTPEPNKASSTSLTGTKTEGTSKVSQSNFAELEVSISDTDGVGGSACAAAAPDEPYEASVEENVEKCKVNASMKGDSSTSPDSVISSSVSVSCELGDAGANLVPPPNTAQLDVLASAFGVRTDVTLDEDGTITIKHKGVPDTGDDICD